MRKAPLIAALLITALASSSARADVSDYLGTRAATAKCPRMIVIRPDLSAKNVFHPVDEADMETGSNMVGACVAGKSTGASVLSAAELESLKSCDSPVHLVKLTSYTRQRAFLGQYEGKATVSILQFESPRADSPSKEVEITATGERAWGTGTSFLNAMQAVCDKVQKTSF